ncbi:uncharacterized protein LOC123565768 [Mercenaria mercenaria]|uniref:uncharacterized protein LOC123565768 n=1 Tax=Mercenaria mercenaria TaxID=6596 RepID=UPI00234E5D5D|nr:uncharacterized protein LOC123565768 [Mercenaria mercenaria]
MMESSDKETRAIFLNFKELRCLEKNMQALDLEKSYNISLINLDQKVVKVKYKRLKDKVSRIKSHLNQDELEELKKLEEEGKLNVKTPASDLNIKIIAAEKRLKLMPRAKSAVPRLQSGTCNEKKTDILKTPRSARRVRTPASTPRKERPLSPPSPQSTSRSRPVSAMLDNAEKESDYLVPKSVREERRNSIDIRCLNDDIKALKVPSVNVITEDDSHDTNSLHGSNSSQKELDIHTIDLNNRNKSNSLHATSPRITIADRGINKHKNPSTNSNTKNVTGNDSNISNKKKTCSKSTADDRKKSGSPIIKVTIADIDESSAGKSSFLQLPQEGNVRSAVGKGSNQEQSSKSRIRPMSVPATQVTDFGATSKKNRPKTAIELAVETRKKSVIDIRRASAMLKEGKTRSPFSSHEQDTEEKKEKPFRSIREGINTTNADSEILDNTLGDDLHKEMKKGMILGEVATSLYLEEKIDTFLEKVDGYVKENPNYVYDPDAPKTKKVPRNKEKKRPKRNLMRRRQLERQLYEVDVEEMKKSRWLRMDDDKLDISGMNTLVVDQMKMLNRLRHPYDDD